MKKLLLLMKTLLCVILLCAGATSAWAANWTSGSVVDAGDFYLYNIGADRFLNRGSSWTTHAVADGQGLVATIASTGEGTYSLATGINKGYVNTCWIDGDKYDYTFESVPVDGYTNAYKINCDAGYLYWSASTGSFGNEILNSAEITSGKENNFYWLLIPKATRENTAGAALETPLDVTYLMTNPDFEYQVSNNGNASAGVGSGQNVAQGWTTGGFWRQNSSQTFANANFFEKYSGGGLTTADALYQTVNLEAGTYRLTATGNASCTKFYLYAGTTDLTQISTAGSYEVVFDVAEDADVQLGAKIVEGGSGAWVAVDNFRLYYYGTETSASEVKNQVLIQSYNAAVTAANAVDQSAAMCTTELTALQTAISTYGSLDTKTATADELTTATTALTTATTNANTSISAYAAATSANISAYLTKMKGVLDNTNVYTTDAYNTYYANIQSAYDARTLSTEIVQTLNENGAYSTGWHSANRIDDVLLSTWKIGGEQCKDYEKSLYINTWSTEGNTDGSEFLTPFFEYWVADASSLGANTLTSTVTGLTANSTYSVSVRARVRQTDGQTKIADGITMQVGSGDAVDISAGAQFGTGQFYIGNFSAVGQTDADGKLVTTITVAENSNISWLSFYNVKYQDMSSLVAAFTAKQTEATGLLANATYTNVVGTERTALTNAKNATPSTFDEYTAANNTLQDAIDAFKAAVGNYDALVAEIAHAKTLGVATATADSYAATSESTSATVAANVQALNVEEYNYVTTNFTGTVTLGSWTNAPGTLNGQSYDGTAEDTYYDLNNSAERSMTQSITLPAGVYILYAKGRSSAGGSLTMSDGTTTVQFPTKGDTGKGIETDGTANFGDGTFANSNNGRGWEYRFIKITSDGSAKTLTFVWTTASSQWAGLDDIVLCGAAATDEQKTALANAITAAEAKTLGFEDGEYAPYNNLESIAILAAAKAIDPDEVPGSAVVAATTALTGATWTANVGEKNAIYWADYTSGDIAGDGYIHPLGWTNTGYNTRIYSEAAGNKETNTGISAVNNLAMMSKYNTTYGETTGYTMPLKAATIYKLTFKYCGWGNTPTTNIVLTDPESNTITLAPGFRPATNNGNTNAENWYSYTGYFVSTTAGNYVLAMNKVDDGQQQIGIGDIELVSASEIVFADGSVPTYAPGTYPSVKISRTLTANRWATAVYPFAVSGVDNIAVLDSYDKSTGALGFTTAAASTANKPFLMRSTAGATEIALSNVAVAAASATNATASEASLIGAYAATEVTNSEKNYVLSNNVIYPVGEAGATINPYRAYIQLSQDPEARSLSFVIDGLVTGIESVEGASEATLKDGKYFENGKVVIVKNGKKYNAAGAQVK